MPVPFAAVSGPLIDQIHTARARGDEHTAAQMLRDLLALYVRLGHRELGTQREQVDYIVARHLGYVPEVLQELGVTADDLPEPPGRRHPAPPPGPGPGTAAFAERHAHYRGEPDNGPRERFGVEYRPQDNVVLHGRRLPFAVVDTEDRRLPVSWYNSRDDAETIAGIASRLRRTD